MKGHSAVNTTPTDRLEELKAYAATLANAEAHNHPNLSEMNQIGTAMLDIIDPDPTPKFIVDGHRYNHPDSALAGDGGFPPFYIFHPESQTYGPITFTSRATAQKFADWLNA